MANCFFVCGCSFLWVFGVCFFGVFFFVFWRGLVLGWLYFVVVCDVRFVWSCWFLPSVFLFLFLRWLLLWLFCFWCIIVFC